MSEFIHYVFVGGIFWAVFCRARLMDEDTRSRLKWQYAVLLLGAMLSLPVWGLEKWSDAIFGASLCLYLWFDSRRWKAGVPRA